ncbi:MAG: membrane protein insertase YidC [Treponema sp.]|jgi:YidC/Oxa1 family membrane protein insertase|nr:membrane protein insertase YidC [Treponema sp.]
MEKRTILAVVLSIVVMLGFYFIMALVYPPVPASLPASGGLPAEVPVVTGTPTPGLAAPEAQQLPAEAPAGVPAEAGELLTTADSGQAETLQEQRVTIETDLVIAEFSNAGGDLVSWRLKNHSDGAGPLEMLLSGDREAHGFTVAFGNMDTQPLNALFRVERPVGDPYTVAFSQDFMIPGGGQFRLTKRYTLKPNEYMFEMAVSLDGGYSMPGFSFPGNPGATAVAYTLGFGPQIGPAFDKLDQRYEYRNYFSFTNGKRKQEKVSEGSPTILNDSRASWFAIAGKYFTLIAIPLLPQYDLALSARAEAGLNTASRLYISRQELSSPRNEDIYRFYLGPKTQEDLQPYNTGTNGFFLKDMQLVEVANSKGFLAPLEMILKVLLTFFNRIVHNYGVAIILLTLLVKVLFFPLTKKGSESMVRMQALTPKIKEIQEKYKDNSQKMNMAMADFYKKEGYNPLSGCLPQLLQLPIFFAMYNLFNNHFDLRGAMFIPGWIPDLSVPESVLHFENFTLPILGWTDIRLLPFIYVGSQLLYGKVTQTPDQRGNSQMKIMMYALPLVFFFILYDVPSGLLVYWIMSNVLSMVQQVTINKYLAQKRAELAAAQTSASAKTEVFKTKNGKGPVIAPRKRKR